MGRANFLKGGRGKRRAGIENFSGAVGFQDVVGVGGIAGRQGACGPAAARLNRAGGGLGCGCGCGAVARGCPGAWVGV